MSAITATAKTLNIHPYKRYSWMFYFGNRQTEFHNLTLKEAIATARQEMESKRCTFTEWRTNPVGRCMGRMASASVVLEYRHPRYKCVNGATLRPAHIPAFFDN